MPVVLFTGTEYGNRTGRSEASRERLRPRTTMTSVSRTAGGSSALPRTTKLSRKRKQDGIPVRATNKTTGLMPVVLFTGTEYGNRTGRSEASRERLRPRTTRIIVFILYNLSYNGSTYANK